MDSQHIYDILSSQEHNQHYLRRYLKFVESFRANKRIKHETNNHHICPKSMFPEYSKLKNYPWNSVILTHRQHFIAHWLLWKAYKNLKMTCAFKRMIHPRARNSVEIKSSRTYDSLMIDVRKHHSEFSKNWIKTNGHPKGTLGKKLKMPNGTHAGSKNPMYGRKRPDLAKMNADPILAKLKGEKLKISKPLKNNTKKAIKLGFNNLEECKNFFIKYKDLYLFEIYELTNKNIDKRSLRELLIYLQIATRQQLKETREVKKLIYIIKLAKSLDISKLDLTLPINQLAYSIKIDKDKLRQILIYKGVSFNDNIVPFRKAVNKDPRTGRFIPN